MAVRASADWNQPLLIVAAKTPFCCGRAPLRLSRFIAETGLKVAAPASTPDKNTAPLAAPGQLASHYAPSAKVRLNAANIGEDEIFIGFGALPNGVISEFNLSPEGDLHEAAARLFAIMHLADKKGAKSIAFAPIPMSGLGLAINDRLARAAAPRTPE